MDHQSQALAALLSSLCSVTGPYCPHTATRYRITYHSKYAMGPLEATGYLTIDGTGLVRTRRTNAGWWNSHVHVCDIQEVWHARKHRTKGYIRLWHRTPLVMSADQQIDLRASLAYVLGAAP